MPRWLLNTAIYSFVSVFFVLLFAAMADHEHTLWRPSGRRGAHP
jgi:hypothetical protein